MSILRRLFPRPGRKPDTDSLNALEPLIAAQATDDSLEDPVKWGERGRALLADGKGDEAEPWLRRSVAAGDGSSLPGLIQYLLGSARVDEAQSLCTAALAVHPNDPQVHMLLGHCALAKDELDNAIASFEQVVATAPMQWNAWFSLGVAFRMADRRGDALLAFEKAAAACNPQDAHRFDVDLALAHRAVGHIAKAIEILEANLVTDPTPERHRTYGQLLLTSGRFAEGWHHHEFRWMTEPLCSMRMQLPIPAWDGQDLTGRSILLRLEQGIGDTIQFMRYAACLQQLGARVVIGPMELAKQYAGVDQVLDAPIRTGDIDYYVNLMSLPRVFGTDTSTIPLPNPYITPAPDKLASWKQWLAGYKGLRVGLVWAGNPGHPADMQRSVRLTHFAPLLAVPGTQFFSLQKGAQAGQLSGLAEAQSVIDLNGALDDLGDTAAAITQLDLVICVDTSVAHLAGALGTAVWVMVPIPCDWRWMEGREDSPWYPAMRLFRQIIPGDWSHVVDRMITALRPLAGNPDRAPTPRSTPTRALPKPMFNVLAGHREGSSAVTQIRAGILQYLPDEPSIGLSLAWYGEYLQSSLDVLATYVLPGMTILEADAGVGVHTLQLAALLGPAGRYLASESRPAARQILQQNLVANRLRNVSILSGRLGVRPRASEGLTTATEAIDDLRLDRLDMIKLNGHSGIIDALTGAEDTLWRQRPLVFVESADDSIILSAAERLKARGYRCWRSELSLFNHRNFNRREHDVFEGRTATTLLAIPEEIELASARPGGVELT